MPQFTGSVSCVLVSDESGFTVLVDKTTNTSETFILWWDGFTTPALPAARTRIAQSDWVGLLRQAMASNIPVVITTDSTPNAHVLSVQLGL